MPDDSSFYRHPQRSSGSCLPLLVFSMRCRQFAEEKSKGIIQDVVYSLCNRNYLPTCRLLSLESLVDSAATICTAI